MQHLGDAAAIPQQCLQAFDDAGAVVMRRGGRLVRSHRAVRVDADQVGEGAADIDADAQGHVSLESPPFLVGFFRFAAQVHSRREDSSRLTGTYTIRTIRSHNPGFWWCAISVRRSAVVPSISGCCVAMSDTSNRTSPFWSKM